jgi:chromosome segregation ATPase
VSDHLSNRVHGVELEQRDMRINNTLLQKVSVASSRNDTIMFSGIVALEKTLIRMRSDITTTRIDVEGLNESVKPLPRVDVDLRDVQKRFGKFKEMTIDRLALLGIDTKTLTRKMNGMYERTANLDQGLTGLKTNLSRSHDNFNEAVQGFGKSSVLTQKDIRKLYNRTTTLRSDMTGMDHFATEAADNISKLVVYATENKASIMECRNRNIKTENLVDRLFVLSKGHTAKAEEHKASTGADVALLNGNHDSLKTDVDNVRRGLEKMLTRITGNMFSQMDRVKSDGKQTKDDLDMVRFELSKVKSDTTSINAFVSSMRNHVSVLTSNMTSVSSNLTHVWSIVKDVSVKVMSLDGDIIDVRDNVTENRNGLILAGSQLHLLRLNSNTLKTNMLGLGDYINTINGDLGKLANTFENYVDDLSGNASSLSKNVSRIELSLEKETSSLRNSIHSAQQVGTTLKGQITTITSKVYDMKTDLFRQQTEISSLKAEHDNLSVEVKSSAENLDSVAKLRTRINSILSATKNDVSTLRTGLTSITNSLFNIKAQILDSEVMQSKIKELESDVESVQEKVANFDSSLYNNKKQSLFYGQSSSSEERAVGFSDSSSVGRFSCAVTGDEIRKSGVVTYDVCDVNVGRLMEKETGHVSVTESGDYLLTFTANMVSVNAQAVWCALYKQSASAAGNEGWQVLGMINNYQKDLLKSDSDSSGPTVEADRDSGSVTVIASLRDGDKVWVEWRGYGQSFLYSNPYRLISFTGFLIAKA